MSLVPAFCKCVNVFQNEAVVEKRRKPKKTCAVRESNPGLVNGNDEFYH
jgi:hypothetical protein